MFLAHPEKTSELAGKRVIRLVVVLITPDDDLENLGADLAPALQRCTHSAAHRPIFGHGRRDPDCRNQPGYLARDSARRWWGEGGPHG